MRDKPWTIIVEGDERKVPERMLEDHAEGTIVEPSIQVVSDVVDGDRRTVTITRPVTGKHFSFHSHYTTIRFINAVGSTAEFSYHQNKEASSMLVLPVMTPSGGNIGGGMCLCQQEPPAFGQAKGGSLEYNPVQGQAGERGVKGRVKHDNRCDPYPRMDLLEQKNPTCDVRTYVSLFPHQESVFFCNFMSILKNSLSEFNKNRPEVKLLVIICGPCWMLIKIFHGQTSPLHTN